MQMRSLLGAVALVAVLLAVSVRAAVHSKASDAACAVAPTPTVTFVASCTTIDVTDASCWTPRVPGTSDVVAFPAGTKASMPFALTYTPLSVQSVYVAPSAVVTLNGGAIAVSSCLTVFGTLALHNRVLDNGTASTIPFAADPSVPLGTDCSVVNAGFTPRVCGPGQVYVSGTLSLQGLYASLWAPTTVAAAGKLTAQRETFVWGTVTNYGTLTSSGYLFLHGSISNLAGASASFQQVRADFWTVNPVVTNNSVSIVNSGTLTFTVPKGWGIFNYASTRGWINYYPNDSWSAIVNLQLVNQASGQVTFSAPRVGLYQPWADTYGISSFYIVNHGTVTWSGSQFYDGVGLQGYPNAYGTGVVTNYGVLIADTSVVTINVVSEGGTMQTVNNGRFSLGMSAARRDSLRARGFVLSSSPVVTLRNTRIESVDATGSVTNLVPMALEGTLSVGPGATLVNGNKEGTTIRHLTTRASKGRVMIAGKYVTGSHEAVFSDDRAVSAELLASGTMHIAKGDVAVLRSDARLHVARGAVLHVDGSLITEHVAQAARHHGLKISPQSFIVGKEHVTGDGIIPSAPLDA